MVVKVYLAKDEYYPFMSTNGDENFGVEVEVDERALRRWWDVLDAFYEVQDEMYEMYDAGTV